MGVLLVLLLAALWASAVWLASYERPNPWESFTPAERRRTDLPGAAPAPGIAAPAERPTASSALPVRPDGIPGGGGPNVPAPGPRGRGPGSEPSP